jgi:hypothetical protein
MQDKCQKSIRTLQVSSTTVSDPDMYNPLFFRGGLMNNIRIKRQKISGDYRLGLGLHTKNILID